MLECCLPFPVSVGTFTTALSSGESVSEIRPPSKPFQQCVSLSPLYAGKDIFLWGRKGIKRECVFRPLSGRDCLASNTGDLQTFPEDLIFKSRQCVSRHIPSLVNTFFRPHCNCPWGSRLQEYVWECWLPYCAHLVEVTFHCKWAWGERFQGSSFLQKCQWAEEN